MSVAISGAVVGIAGTAYSVYSQEQAKDAASSLKPRPFVPVDIKKVAQMALVADQAGFSISDNDWKERFPKLALGREYNISDVGMNLAGGTSATVKNEMDRSGLSADLGSTEREKARNLNLPLASIEQRDRNYFQKQLAMNPQRTAGLSGRDVANIAVANTAGQNSFSQGVFQSKIAQYNAGVAQGIQNVNAGINAFGSLASMIPPQQQQRSPYETGSIFSGAPGPTTNASGTAPYGWG